MNISINEDCNKGFTNKLDTSSQKYKGQIYKSIKVTLNPPKKEIIPSITNIKRDIRVKDIEVLENGLSVNLDISVSLNYGTSKNILIKNEHSKVYEKEDVFISEKGKTSTISIDGDVRNSTVIVPSSIYINIPKDKMCSKYKIVNQCLKVSNTQYILEDGFIASKGVPIGNSLNGVIENYIISVELEVI